MQLTGESSVLAAITAMGGVYMLGRNLPIWVLVLIEFVLAFSLEMILGSPCSFKLASKVFNPKEVHPVLIGSESGLVTYKTEVNCSNFIRSA